MEKLSNPEKKIIPPLNEGVHIVLMRHGEPLKPEKGQELSEESKDSIGMLTENGKKETRQMISKIIDQAIIQHPNKKIILCFLGSPTQLQIDGETFGARGMHTADVASREAESNPMLEVRYIGDSGEVRPWKLLREADYYYAPEKSEPERYVAAIASRAANVGVDKQDIWLQQPEDLEAIRIEDKLESPAATAQRLARAISVLNRHSKLLHRKDNEEIYYVAVTHGDTLKAFLKTYFNDEPKAEPLNQNPLVGSEGYNASVILGNTNGNKTSIEASFLTEV